MITNSSTLNLAVLYECSLRDAQQTKRKILLSLISYLDSERIMQCCTYFEVNVYYQEKSTLRHSCSYTVI